ncbi:amidohydrolase family protein [Pseudomonas sp. FP597]|uniref:Amidohydrolase family protein n=1 Tax=Pseudomonas lactucae TaxID=2813360 RepID=A0A9X0YA78_9PSED|nr:MULTISPECIES: amidohydrolase family protein [Pseudomonas]MBN2975810.1 amidohydrolase family protein [Pseudomonas lactucae]MBN2985862.1 amidohydrolase family protein [Pseudomonas lactucae]WLI08931.1 amidohydrolase family protein [Pseudomonas sp. FP597]
MALLHLIEQVSVVGMGGSTAQVMDVLIDGDRFVGLAPKIDLSTVNLDERTDGRGKLLIPGLINAHHHSHDRFDKGRFSGIPLEIWMGLYNPPSYRRGWTAREVYLRTLLNGIEMLRNGITTVVDDIHFGGLFEPEVVHAAFQAYSDLGIRADVSVAWSDKPFQEGIPYLAERLPDTLKGTVSAHAAARVLEQWQELARSWNGRVRFVFSPSGPQRCSADFLQKTWALAEHYDRPVLIHLLETRIQALTAAKFYGKPMAAYMDDLGLLTPRSVLAHGVWLSAAELDLIAERGASVVHNPACNLKLGSGVAPIAQMLRREVNVGLGTDNNNGNDLNSMFDAMRLAALSNALLDQDEVCPVGALQAFNMATLGGARAIGRGAQTGSIEVGKQADFCLIDLKTSAFTPLNDALTQLVFCEQGSAVRDVYVGGRKLVDHGRITRIDEEALMLELMERMPTLQGRIQGGQDASDTLRPYLVGAYNDCLADPQMVGLRHSINQFDRSRRGA